MTGHLDLDALADAAAGEPEPAADAHLASCAACRATVDEVRAAGERVRGRLAALPAPTLPDDVVRRLQVPPGTVTTLPTAPRDASRGQRLLPAAAAVVLLLAGGGYALSRLGDSTGSSGSNSAGVGTAAKAAPTAGFPRNSTGTDYTGRSDLARAVPGLLVGEGTAQAGAARAPSALSGPATAGPTTAGSATGGSAAGGSAAGAGALDRLRTPAGLADCLLALLPPDDPSVRPLALDYAAFRGRPAMVVVLPAVDPKKVDVYVVGAGCSRANDSTLFYTSVPRP